MTVLVEQRGARSFSGQLERERDRETETETTMGTKGKDERTESGKGKRKSKSNRTHGLKLVAGTDFSTLGSHTETHAGLPDSSSSSFDSSQLVPSADLTALLSDPELRRRYKEGRYVAGRNVNVRVAAWITPISVAVNSVASRCTPSASMAVVSSLSLHIGIRAISAWECVGNLKSVQEDFTFSSPDLSSSTIDGVKRLLDTLQPSSLGGSPRNLVVPEWLDDELKRLSGATGMQTSQLSVYCIMATLSEQSNVLVNRHKREEMRERVLHLRRWLRWKARVIQSAIEEFDRED